MEVLVPDSLKPPFLSWNYTCDELKASVEDASAALSTGRGVTLLTSKQKNLERVISRFERQWEDLSTKLLAATVPLEEFYKFYSSQTRAALQVQEKLAEGIDQMTSSPHVHTNVPLKLPEIKLPEFSGNFEEWTQFWDLFTSLVDKRSDLPVSVKFNYLKNSLRGPSAKLVAGFSITDGNYQQAKDLLLQQYQNEDRCVRQLVHKLYDLKRPQHEYKELLNFRTTYNQLIRSLGVYKDMTTVSWLIC